MGAPKKFGAAAGSWTAQCVECVIRPEHEPRKIHILVTALGVRKERAAVDADAGRGAMAGDAVTGVECGFGVLYG